MENTKRIIAATDFSENASHAMFYAAAIAGKLNCPLVMMNVYDLPIAPTSEPSLMVIPFEEMHDITTEKLEETAEKLRKKHPELQVEVKALLGDVAEQLNEISKDEPPLLVILGSKEKRDDGGLFGSATDSIVSHTKHPVLSIPEQFPIRVPSKAVLATDLTPLSENVRRKIRTIVETLGLELHLVHVTEKDAGESHEELLQSLEGTATQFKTVISSDLAEGLENYAQEVGADLVISLPHNRSWLESLFVKKHTADLVSHLHLPLLCIPE